ncbi:hypothetical protein PENTCL1PPCAC_29094, partial [Pristionchus entomophagus]
SPMRLLLIILLFFKCAHSYKILVYIPKFAISHISFMGKLADTLVDAGHDVTALISEMDADLPDGTIKVTKIIRVPPAQNADHMRKSVERSIIEEMRHCSVTGLMTVVQNAYHNSVSFSVQCRTLLSTPGLIEQLKQDEYDALIAESFDHCGVGISHLISPRALIPVSSTFLYNLPHFGVHYSFTTEPSTFVDGRFHTSLSSRITTIYLLLLFPAFYNTMNDPLQRVFDDLYPGTPSISSLLSNAAVIFSNTDPLIDFARPSIAKIVPIGGIGIPSPQPLEDV